MTDAERLVAALALLDELYDDLVVAEATLNTQFAVGTKDYKDSQDYLKDLRDRIEALRVRSAAEV